MNSVARTTSLSDEQVIAQFVGQMCDQYEKLELLETDANADRINADNRDRFGSQVVAPWDGTSPLNAAMFIRVRYRELNVGGFSFWIDRPPTTPFFAVAFEKSDGTTMLKARVVGTKLDSTLGDKMHLIKTEFVDTV